MKTISSDIRRIDNGRTYIRFRIELTSRFWFSSFRAPLLSAVTLPGSAFMRRRLIGYDRAISSIKHCSWPDHGQSLAVDEVVKYLKLEGVLIDCLKVGGFVHFQDSSISLDPQFTYQDWQRLRNMRL